MRLTPKCNAASCGSLVASSAFLPDEMAPLRDAVPLYWLEFAILMVAALGPSIEKPVVVGTTARGRRGSPFTEAPAVFRA
jgi:hypothetical protein